MAVCFSMILASCLVSTLKLALTWTVVIYARVFMIYRYQIKTSQFITGHYTHMLPGPTPACDFLSIRFYSSIVKINCESFAFDML